MTACHFQHTLAATQKKMKKRNIRIIKLTEIKDNKEKWLTASIDDRYGIVSRRVDSRKEFFDFLKEHIPDYEFEEIKEKIKKE